MPCRGFVPRVPVQPKPSMPTAPITPGSTSPWTLESSRGGSAGQVWVPLTMPSHGGTHVCLWAPLTLPAIPCSQVTTREQVLQQQLGRSLQAQEAQLDTLRKAVQDKATLAKEQAALAQLAQLASVEAADLRCGIQQGWGQGWLFPGLWGLGRAQDGGKHPARL